MRMRSQEVKIVMYTCIRCKKSFTEEQNLKQHHNSFHPCLTHQEQEKLPKEEGEKSEY